MVRDANTWHTKTIKMAEVLLQTSDSRGIDTPLVDPVIRPYYADGFGSKSIGEPEWRPHPRNALSVPGRLDNSVRGGNGLDWFSSLRCATFEDTCTTQISSSTQMKETVQHITKDSDSLEREQAFQVPSAAPRPLSVEKEENPTSLHKPQAEYDNYDDFEKIYMRRPLEISLRMSLGAKRKVFDKRNGIPAASLGDKSYQVPECSLEFHKQGSTRPVVNFGGQSLKYVADTFVPVQDLPLKPRVSFEEKEKIKLKRQEVDEVKNLDNWQPADPLTPAMQFPGTQG